MADVTPTTLRGLVIPDDRLSSVAQSLSDYTEASPIPGAPVPDDGTPSALEVSGVSDGYDLEVRTLQAGSASSARLGWRYDGDTYWRGWVPPVSLFGWERVSYSVVGSPHHTPHAVTLPTGEVVVVVSRLNRWVYAYTRATDGTWGAGVEVYDRGSTYTNADGANPCLVVMPSGRLLCFFWREGSSTMQIRAAFSDDKGATWETLQRECLESAISIGSLTFRRLRAAHNPANGQVMVVAWVTDGTDEQIYQWASIDVGATLRWVQGGAVGAYPDVVATAGGFTVGWLAYSTPLSRVVSFYVNTSSAYTDISQLDAGYIISGSEQAAYSGGNISEGELSLCADEAGRIYAFVIDRDPGVGDVRVAYIDDPTLGVGLWTYFTSGPSGYGAAWCPSYSTTVRPVEIAATWQGGRALLLHNAEGSGETGASSLSVLVCGGWDTLEVPTVGGNTDYAVPSWSSTWAALALPQSLGWSASTVGPPTITLATGGLSVTSTAGQTVTYSHAVTTTLAEGIAVTLDCTVASGTTFASALLSSGAVSYQATVKVTSSSVALYDGAATSTTLIGSSVATTDAGTGIQIRLVLQGSTAAAWYRAAGDSYWQPIASGTPTSGTSPTSTVSFGARESTSANLRMLTYAAGDLQTHVTSPSLPSDLRGRAPAGAPIWLTGGTLARLAVGPVVTGDGWSVPATAEYPVEALSTASPRHVWRSQADGVEQSFVWEVSSTFTRASPALGRAWALHLTGINFRTAALYGRTAAGSWVKLADIDTEMGTGLHYTRTGEAVYANGGPQADHPIPENALANCYFEYATNGTRRRIVGNSGGIWGGSSSATQAMLRLDGVGSGDASSGSDGTIYSDRVTVIVPGSSSQAYSALKLVIAAQSTPEGYYTCGRALMGRFVPFARRYSWGRALSWESGVEVQETAGGVRRTLRRKPMRRAVKIAWPDGADTLNAHAETPDHIHIYQGGPAVASPGEVAYQVPGLFEALQGASSQVVYLASVEVQGSQTAIIIPHRWLQLYGSILTETLQIDTIIGDEWSGEVFRIGQVEISEEV